MYYNVFKTDPLLNFKTHEKTFRFISLHIVGKIPLTFGSTSPYSDCSSFVHHRHIDVGILAIPLIVCEKSYGIFSQNKDKNHEIA